ncbi:hypothetical protein V1264_024649 [Littorina saxatilis]|uniref:Uncharacterized protein n=1 Tax=Littorina saxatilis TaxID=31220 RepID=A0AAN9AM44_9CAEN
MIGLPTDKWQTRESADSNISSTAGIWSCTNELCDRDEDMMLTCKVTGVFGAVLMLGCILLESAMMAYEGCRKYCVWVFIFMDILGFICMVTEFAVYVKEMDMELDKFGYSSIMTIFAFLFSIAGLICCVLAYKEHLVKEETTKW